MLKYIQHKIVSKVSRRNQIPHGKAKILTAKAKSSRQNQKAHGQNQKAHGKTKKLTAKPKAHGKIKKLTAKPKTHGKTKNSRQNQKLTAKPKPEKGVIFVGPGHYVHAKAVGVKSNMAASSSLSSQMFCSNCGAEAVPTANFCTRCGQGNRVKINK